MPYKHTRKLIPKEYNANTKLDNEDRAEIRQLYKAGGWSQRKLAAKFGVSRRLITFILDPEKHAKQKRLYAERQKTGRYYDKDKHREYMRRHRQYKQSLMQDGKLIDKEDHK